MFNSVASHQKLTKGNANSQFTVNSFIIKSATNELDPYGIVKITNNLGYTKIYQLDEVNNIKIQDHGEWKIELIDRLGNTASFFVNIYSPSIVSKLTLMNKGEVYSESYVSGGERIKLNGSDVMKPTDPNYEFIGWSDSNGKIYNGSFLCNFNKDTVLTAEYRFVSTKVSVYDGGLIDKPFIAKPYEKLLLPSNLSREGLEFYGYKYNVNGEERFCIGQLNSVPNVAELRLDAVYLDKSTGLKITSGQSLEKQTKANYTFYGWGTGDRGENAIVFTGDKAEFTVSESLEVYALYIANEGNLPIIAGGSVINDSFFNQLFQGISGAITSSVQNGSLFFAIAVILLIAYLVMRFKKKGMLSFCKFKNSTNLKVGSNKLAPAMQEARQEAVITFEAVVPTMIEKQAKIKIYVKRPKIKWSLVFSSAVCFLLVVVLGSFATDKFLYSASASYKDFKQEQAIERQFEEYENDVLAQKEAQKEQENIRNNYIVKVQDFKTRESEIENSDEFNEEVVFVNNLISLDLDTKGYETFSASVTKANGDKINGIGYTNFEYIEIRNNVEYYQAGFISDINEAPLTSEDIFTGMQVEENIDDDPIENVQEGYAFDFVLNEKAWTDHYIAFDEYCKYTVDNYNITYCAVTDDPSLYDIGIGYLYNYDLGRAVYDPDLGKEFDKSAYDITAGLDYDKLIETYRTIIDYQNKNGIKIESTTFTAIDVSAINEYILHGQQEEFLGIAPEQIQFIESQVSNSSFYYIDGVIGQISVLEIPSAPPEDSSATIWNIINIVLNSLMIVGGVVLCITTFWTGAGLGAGIGLIVGGVVGFVAQYFQEEIGGFLNNLIGADGMQAMGGGFSVVMGGVTINIGTKLIGKGGGGVPLRQLFVSY